MVDLLLLRGLSPERIHIFSADGDDHNADLASRESQPKDFWLIEGTRLGKPLRPRTQLTNTPWRGLTVHAARQAALRKWFESASHLVSGDRLLIFVTYHGTTNRDDPDNGAISLWHEKLTVQEFKGLLALLQPGVRVVMVMSQCYSGAFANAMYDGGSSGPSGQVCGFFSTTRDLRPTASTRKAAIATE